MPTQTFTQTASTFASPKEVWIALQKPQTWEAIPGVDRVFDPVIDSVGALRGFSFESVAAGKTYLGQATPADRVEGESMTWNIKTSEVNGVLSVEIAPSETGSDLTVTLSVESLGILSSMFFPVIAGSIGSGFPEAVKGFAASLD